MPGMLVVVQMCLNMRSELNNGILSVFKCRLPLCTEPPGWRLAMHPTGTYVTEMVLFLVTQIMSEGKRATYATL